MSETIGAHDQYSTVEPMFRARPTWLSGFHQKRIASYNTYEQIYWNIPETFRVVERGTGDKPILIPSGKQIVETLHRFLANDLSIIVDKEFGQDTERNEAMNIMTDLLRRERFVSRFTANKRYGIIRGDWLWHLYADPERSEGHRISILPLDPAAYFPLWDDENPDSIVGCHLVEPFVRDNGEEVIRRLTYRKKTETGGPSPIIMSDALFEVDAWGQPETEMGEKRVEQLVDETELPSPIDSLPVYHIPNFMDPNPSDPWGSSEMRGIERLIMAINQGISDEEIALALEGLGVYVTNAGKPVDENGNEVPWIIAPAQVLELSGDKEDTYFDRVEGIKSIDAMQDHLEYLHNQMNLGTGTPSVAQGEVDVDVAESGVALAIRLGPLLARAEEKELSITDVMVNLLFDLRKWIIAYEPQSKGPMENIRWIPNYGDKIPMNRQQRFQEIMKIADVDGLVSAQWVRDQLKTIGYEFPEHTEMMDQILQEKDMFGRIDADIEAFRMGQEIAQG